MKITLDDLKGRKQFKKRFSVSAITRNGAMFKAHELAGLWFDTDDVFVKVKILGYKHPADLYQNRSWRVEMKVMNAEVL